MTLHVESCGSGPDLALIHGWGFAGRVWEPAAAILAQSFRVHCVDLPGYGGSHELKPGTVQQVADQMMAALPAKVSLCGWSLGAHVAIAALSRHSQSVDDLVLVGATPCFLKRPDWTPAIDASMLVLFDTALRRDPAGLLSRFSLLINQGDEAAVAIKRQLAPLAKSPPSIEVLEHGLDLLRQLDLRPLLPRIHHRTLLIHGAHDPLMPLAAASWTASVLPQARLDVFENAAHTPFLSHPKRFAQAIADFRANPTPC